MATQLDNSPQLPSSCLLDLTFSSALLSSKIHHVKQTLKFETIMKPIFDYYYGPLEEVFYDWTLEERLSIIPERNFELDLRIDWIKDKNYIFDQLFDLPHHKFFYMAKCLGLWNNKSFVMKAIYYQIKVMEHLDVLANDREVILAGIKENVISFTDVNEELKKDNEIQLEAIKNNDNFYLRTFLEKFKKNKELVKTAVKADPFWNKPYGFEYDKELCLISMNLNTRGFFNFHPSLLKDKEILKKYLNNPFKIDPRLISKEIYNNKELFLSLLKKQSISLKFASKKLRNDRELVQQVIRKDGMSLQYAPEIFKKDIEIVKDAILQNKKALQFASDELRYNDEMIELTGDISLIYNCDDRRIVLESVTRYGRNLKNASDDLKNDREIVMAAVTQNGNSIKYASYELRNDRQVFLQAIKTISDEVLERLKVDFDNLSQDTEISMILINNFGWLDFAPKHIISNREIVLQAVKKKYFSINFISEELQHDWEIALEAMSSCPYCYHFIDMPDEFYESREFFLQLCQKSKNRSGNLFFHYRNDKEIILKAIGYVQSLSLYFKMSRKLYHDRDIALKMVKTDNHIFECLCSELRNDKEIVLAALKLDNTLISYVSYELKSDPDVLEAIGWSKEFIKRD